MSKELDFLRKEWGKTWQQSGAVGDPNEPFNTLIDFSNKKPRTYHTLEEHIYPLFLQFQDVRKKLKDPLSVSFGLFFHDAIYDPRSYNSEEKSGIFAREVMEKAQLPQALIRRVEDLIAATTHRETAEGKDPDMQYLTDMDLSIFSECRERFNRYEKGVLAEYRWVIDELGREAFIVERLKVLKGFRDREPLYLSDHYRWVENEAKENLARSIARLERGVLPGERLAVYAGSFDPFTNGHLEITEQASKLFDHVVVAVGQNPNKPSGRFPVEERLQMIRESVPHLTNVSVGSFADLTVRYADEIGADLLVRGVRNTADFEEEKEMVFLNSSLSESLLGYKLPIVHIFGSSDSVFVRSSAIMGLTDFYMTSHAYRKYVPQPVIDRILGRP